MSAFRLVTFIAATLAATQAFAGPPYDLSGLVVYNHCKSSDDGCWDFLATMDSAVSALWRLGFINRFMCAPANATLGQDRLIFLRFAERNPQFLNRNAAEVYLAAEIEAFPCAR